MAPYSPLIQRSGPRTATERRDRPWSGTLRSVPRTPANRAWPSPSRRRSSFRGRPGPAATPAPSRCLSLILVGRSGTPAAIPASSCNGGASGSHPHASARIQAAVISLPASAGRHRAGVRPNPGTGGGSDRFNRPGWGLSASLVGPPRHVLRVLNGCVGTRPGFRTSPGDVGHEL